MKALFDAGVPIVAGTDGALPGYSLLRSIEMYVEAGLTPMQAIESATRVPAESMGLGTGHGHDRGGQARRHDRAERRSAGRRSRTSASCDGSSRTGGSSNPRSCGPRQDSNDTDADDRFSRRCSVCSLGGLPQAPPLPAERAIVDPDLDRRLAVGLPRRFTPPTLTRSPPQGVRAEGLIPQFPSKTFPNHYTIVTGLTLAHHGIISNNMRDAGHSGRVLDVESRRAGRSALVGRRADLEHGREAGHGGRRRCSGRDRKR